MRNVNPINLFNQFLSYGINPQQIEQMIYQQYPGFRVLSNQMKQSGMNPIEFAMQIARQQNIPIQPNSLNQMANQMWNMVSNKR